MGALEIQTVVCLRRGKLRVQCIQKFWKMEGKREFQELLDESCSLQHARQFGSRTFVLSCFRFPLTREERNIINDQKVCWLLETFLSESAAY